MYYLYASSCLNRWTDYTQCIQHHNIDAELHRVVPDIKQREIRLITSDYRRNESTVSTSINKCHVSQASHRCRQSFVILLSSMHVTWRRFLLNVHNNILHGCFVNSDYTAALQFGLKIARNMFPLATLNQVCTLRLCPGVSHSKVRLKQVKLGQLTYICSRHSDIY